MPGEEIIIRYLICSVHIKNVGVANMLTDATLPQHKLSPIDVARGGYTRFVLH